MKKYFTNKILENIESDNLITALKESEKHPDTHIRILMDNNNMKINLQNEELTIRQAVLFVWVRHDMNLFNEMYCMNFIPQDPERAFYAAILPEEYFASAIIDPEYPLEGVCGHGTKSVIFGIFDTEQEIIYIHFDGQGTSITRSEYDKKDGANVFDALNSIYKNHQQDEKEDIEEDDNNDAVDNDGE